MRKGGEQRKEYAEDSILVDGGARGGVDGLALHSLSLSVLIRIEEETI